MPPPSQFPPHPLADALPIARTIATQNAGLPMRRLDIFDHLKRSPSSGPSRNLVTASSAYALTKGSYAAETLELLPLGRRIVIDDDKSAIVEAVLGIELFKTFFERYTNAAFPADVPARSFLADQGVSPDRVDQCLRIIRANGEFSGLIQQLSGQPRIISREAAIQRAASAAGTTHPPDPAPKLPSPLPQTFEPAVGLTRGMPSINVNLEIHLPGDATPETYDAIFRGIRQNLIDVPDRAD